MRVAVRGAAALLLMTGATPLQAQNYLSYYTVQHPDRFPLDWKSFYREVGAGTAEARKTLPHHLDIAYGPGPKQKLDIYQPKAIPKNAPVLVFLHGGGFLEGDRADYGFVAPAFAKHGIVVVIASYRLVSNGFSLPDAVADAKSVLTWVHWNIAHYGGNPNTIVLSGHSAGAILSANLAVDLGWMQADHIPTHSLKAIVVVSGIYNFRAEDHSRDSILPTPEIKETMSAIRHINQPTARVVVAAGSLENDPVTDYVSSSTAFFHALESGGQTRTKLLILPGQNHQATARALADETSPLFKATLDAFH